MMMATRQQKTLLAWMTLCCTLTPQTISADTSAERSDDCLRPPFLPVQSPEMPDLPQLPSLTSAPERTPNVAEERLHPRSSFHALSPGDVERRKLLNRTEGEWGILKSETILRAPEPPRETPFERGEWSTEDTLQIPVSGPLWLFGQAELVGDYAADQRMKVVGRGGVVWKLPVWGETAVELRGGPTVKCADALRLERARDQASFLWELKATMPVSGSIGLEYLGEALPGLTPSERPLWKQDLGLAIPVQGGKVKLGAKHRWESLGQDSPWGSNMEVYVGVEIGR